MESSRVRADLVKLHQVVRHYTLVEALARTFPGSERRIHGAAQLEELSQAYGITGPMALADPRLGEPVTTSRSSWVRLHEIGSKHYFIKTYAYLTTWERLRAGLRWTGPHRASRAAREAAAILWMHAHGFAAPKLCGVVENRRMGFVRLAMIATQSWPGRPVDRLLTDLTPREGVAVASEIGQLLTRLHRAGFRDGNFDLRNLLAQRLGNGAWQLAKIDSPRFTTVRHGRTNDRRARRDWQRLLPQLERFGLAEAAQAGARNA